MGHCMSAHHVTTTRWRMDGENGRIKEKSLPLEKENTKLNNYRDMYFRILSCPPKYGKREVNTEMFTVCTV